MPSIGLVAFVAMMALAVVAVRRAMRKSRERRELETRHPNEPWMWRRDWADRTIRDSDPLQVGFVWIFAILWLLMSIPPFVMGELPPPPALYFLLLFPAIGLLVLLFAIRQWMKRRKYGVSLCRLERVPIALGSTLRGEIQTRVTDVPEQGFQLQLSSIRRIITGAGKNRSTREEVLWQDEQAVGSGRAMPGPEGTRVPFQFSIPPDCEPCDDSNPRDSILWQLAIRADVPGIDYSTRFELPVFGVADSPTVPPQFDPAHWTPSRNIKLEGAGDIVIEPARPFGDWFGYLFFIAIWFGLLALFRIMANAPLWVLIVFAVIGTIVLLGALDFLLGRNTIHANPATLTVRRTWLGLGRERTVPTSEITAITPRVGMNQGARAYWDVRAVLQNHTTVALAKNLREKRDAEGLAARVWRQLGK